MRSALTCRASSRPTFSADDFEWMLGIYLVSFRDKFATCKIWTENPGLPWCAELQNTLHERLLFFLTQYRLDY
jgi:hypothetical protein